MSDQPNQKTKRLYQLDGLRFPMICMIVMSHFEFMIRYTYGDTYTWYFIHPSLAVDFFFVLSGFGLYMFMQKTALEYSLDPKNLYFFARQKIKKIYLPYLFSLILSIPFTILDKTIRHSFNYAVLWTVILFILALTLFQSAFGMSGFSHAINGIGWFLSTLFISYMVFPVVYRGIKKIRNRRMLILSTALCIVLIDALFIIFRLIEGSLSDMLSGHLDDLSYGSPYFRVFFLVLGALIGAIFLKGSVFPKKVFVIVEPVLTVTAFIWFIMGNTIDSVIPDFLSRLIDVVLCSLIVYTFAHGEGVVSGLLKKDFFVRLGELSMFIFLFHYPVRMATDIYFSHNPFVFGNMTGVIEAVLIIIFTLLIIMFYKRILVRLMMRVSVYRKR